MIFVYCCPKWVIQLILITSRLKTVFESSTFSSLVEADTKSLNLKPFLCSVSIAGLQCWYWLLSDSVFGYPAVLSNLPCSTWERTKVLCCLLAFRTRNYWLGWSRNMGVLVSSSICLHEESLRSFCSLQHFFSENLYRHCCLHT